jgi:glycosyltransferase involved in cell wall biosynthesis
MEYGYNMKMRRVLVICAKNESKTIGEVIDQSRKFVKIILVVDGHSKDGTLRVAKKHGAETMVDAGVGKGAAIRQAIDWAKKNDVLIFMDADGSHEPKDIPSLAEPIEGGEADLVIASRGLGGSDELSGTTGKFVRLIGSSIITMVINMRYNSGVTDSQNGFRSIRADVAKKLGLRENGFAIEQEMLMRSLKKEYRVVEIPSHEYERRNGDSKIKLRVETWKYLASLVRGIL